MSRTEALVPMWIQKSGNRVLDGMSSRPVLIEVETLGAVLRGEMVELNMCEARVLPGDPLLLWKNVRLTVRFRYADVVYHLSGNTKESYPDHSFTFDFDKVTRQRMGALREQLRNGGYLKSSEIAPEADSTCEEQVPKDAKGEEREPPTEDLSRVRHLPAPSGQERRLHQRHELHVDATVQKISSSNILRCQVLEISLGGCRIYTDRPNDYVLGDRVEVQFVGRGGPFRLSASVQFERAEHLAGLKFTHMSMRTSDRLVDLVRELSEQKNLTAEA